MRIFYSPNSGDPMLFDQQERLSSLAEELRAMVAVRDGRTFVADTSGSPAPYDELLQGLRVRSVGEGPTTCHIAEDRWLDLEISDADLDQVCPSLEQLQEGNHTHLYSTPLSLIFEADDV